MIEHIKTKSAHSIFYTDRLPLFENLYNNPKVRSLNISGNRLNPMMYFDQNYNLTEQEKQLFQGLISLSEDDFVQFYIPSQERMIHQMSLERVDQSFGYMYIYSRKYNIIHRLDDQGKFNLFHL